MHRWAIVAATLAGVLLAGGVVFFAVVFTGIYDVGVTAKDVSAVTWTLHTTMKYSVRRHAAGVEVPAGIELGSRGTIAAGAQAFHMMCQMCHGAPGERRAEWITMNPMPPDLSDSAAEWTNSELYWIIANGVKMAGMPAFGPSHGERELWEMAAFVRRLPGMTAADYQSLLAEPAAPDAGHQHTH